MSPLNRLAAALLIVVLACTFVSCSSGKDDGDSGEVLNQPTVVPATGDHCDDPVGDLSSDIKASGIGTDPPGIDLVSASATLQDNDTLDVTFTTAGPVTDTEGTSFVVAQNSAGSPLGFEIRAMSKGSGLWGISAITWTPSEQSVSVPVSPTISGNTLRFTVPIEALPPLALYLQFGATTDVDGVGQVIDDCSSLTTAPTVG
jgi:hypothetical protein